MPTKTSETPKVSQGAPNMRQRRIAVGDTEVRQMISCDKCGYGHKTFEEMNACKSWAEMQAERTVPCLKCGGAIPYKEGVCPNCGYKEF